MSGLGLDRFRRRRQAVRRRRWWPWVVGVLVVAVLAAGTWAVGFSTLLSARQVQVEGLDTLSIADVRREAAVASTTPLARVDTDAVVRRVEQMPRVREVTVTRAWPRTLVVDVRERQAVAVVREGDTIRGLDTEGVLFRTYDSAPKRLPSVTLTSEGGESARTDALREIARVVTALDPEVARRVQRVQASSMDAITLVLSGGDQVRWGSASQSARKAEVLLPLLEVPAKVYDVSAPARPTTRT
ncbi:cell division protein FtsQ/DivIB [Solicola sp. PLA-1-18]|uniref:cell division protein FtsQ/DivIB n=1 Tax=Solicola sp. PLA-1-18 TaxID=3380532 RepID=UPI003B7A9B79